MISWRKERTSTTHTRAAIVPLLLLAFWLAAQTPNLLAAELNATASAGVIPEGIWVLNGERSQQYAPGAHILWVFKDDGQRLAWVSFQTDADHNVKVTSWDGCYDGKPVEVAGSGMLASVISPGPGRVSNYGSIPNLGEYSEECELMEKGKRFRCELTITTEQGSNTYIDDFDLHSAGTGVLPALQPSLVDAASRAACS